MIIYFLNNYIYIAEDYYNILNISKSASADEIKKAYRKLAVKWHPDKNKDPGAEDRFKKISEAYDILSDESKRSQYDQFGHAAFQQGGGHGGGFPGGHDPFDIFDSFFKRGNSGQRGGFDGFFTRESNGRQNRNNLGSNMKANVEVRQQDIIKEKSINLSYNRDDKCNPCNGTGQSDQSHSSVCMQCGGRGSVIRNMGILQMEQECPVCSGSGTMIKNPCTSCGGRGISSKKMNTNIKIPIGVHSGMKLRMSDLGNYDKGGYGDLYVFIHVLNDEIYKRDGDDIIRDLETNFVDMILGTQIELDSLYGKVKLKVPPKSKPESVLRVNEYGIPNMNTHNKGDMYVVLKPKFPSELSDVQTKILKEYKQTIV